MTETYQCSRYDCGVFITSEKPTEIGKCEVCGSTGWVKRERVEAQ